MVSEFSRDKEIPTGADDYTPVLIYCVIKTQPKDILTHLNYTK